MYRRRRVAHSICFSRFHNLNFKGLQSVINKININEICVALILYRCMQEFVVWNFTQCLCTGYMESCLLVCPKYS